MSISEDQTQYSYYLKQIKEAKYVYKEINIFLET